ncbi:tetratricopeptide repeat protein [Chromatiaceae bacterium AAb-1]|nr:tetratricopeptide repeat protein [Chromatiaceae bacterium AAb-1]
MEIYSNEEQQVEAIKRFWKEYGKAIAGGVVIGLVGLYGWRYYQIEQRTASEQASSQYNQLLEQQGVSEDWQADVQTFISNNEKNAYATFAALLAAKDAIEKQQYDEAADKLNWVHKNSKDTAVKAIAQLRLARVQREQGDYVAALNTLAQTVPASFVSRQAELRGDILQLTGELAQAKSAYVQALATAGQNQQLIQIKLDELAHITAG